MLETSGWSLPVADIAFHSIPPRVLGSTVFLRVGVYIYIHTYKHVCVSVRVDEKEDELSEEKLNDSVCSILST